jgi:hypothetical protein
MAAMAICIARLGRLENDLDLTRMSLQLYIYGLPEVQKALLNPELMYKDEILGASMALAMYELIECAAETKYGYISHHKGCARTDSIAGSKSSYFRLGPPDISYSTYLSDKVWTEMPWQGIS